jgi:DNA-binding NtrC family response regulator
VAIPKVLIIDDELNILKSLKRLFADESFEVVTTSDPEYAKKQLESEHIGLLISDQRMPRMSGVKLLEFAKGSSPKTIRVLLTAYVDAQVAIDAINLASVHRYMTKPWNDEDLLALVRQSLDHYLISCGEVHADGDEGSGTNLSGENNSIQRSSSLRRDIPKELQDLEPGMILSRDVFTETSRLLLQENSELTMFRLERLKTIEKSDPIRGKIYVYR